MASSDPAREFADKQVEEYARTVGETYGEASRDLRAMAEEGLSEYEAERGSLLGGLDDPALGAALAAWLAASAAGSPWMRRLVERLSERAVEADAAAMAEAGGLAAGVYAENADWAAYAVEAAKGPDAPIAPVAVPGGREPAAAVPGGAPSGAAPGTRGTQGPFPKVGTSFDLMDEGTARVLAEEADLLPRHDEEADMDWHRRKVQSAIAQGIMAGEPVPGIAARIQAVADMDRKAALRAARTACGAAENAGRLDTWGRYARAGMDVRKQWMATLDGRTRSSHRALDGEVRALDEPFSNGCMHPCDPHGPAREVWNCRCTLVPCIDGGDAMAGMERRGKPGGMSYEEWKHGKQITARLRDTVIGKGYGAAAFRDSVQLPQSLTGLSSPIPAKLAEGSRISGKTVIAGKGSNTKIKGEMESLREQFPSVPESDWSKMAGNAVVEDMGLKRKAHVHWYESESTGRVRMKVVKWL